MSTEVKWVILKVTQSCNLNCSYCYVYNRGDESWKDRPRFISEEVIKTLGQRVAEHCRKHSLARFVIELHGGEPLVLGKSRMQRLVRLLRDASGEIDLHFVMQTNGLLLDEEWLHILEANNIVFGLSLDGPPGLADRFRVFHDGRGSTQQLLAKIEALRATGPLFDRLCTGALCVINPGADGAEMVKWFVGHGFRAFDFLLPDGNYTNPPPGWKGPEPYVRFLENAFEEWYTLGANAPHVRLFEVMIRSFMGVKPVLDAMGGDLGALCVVESDGSIGISDVARICGGRFSVDELNVFSHALDLHAEHYELDKLQQPCAQCSACKYFQNCRGGYLPHRFDGNSFDHPSLYCAALFNLADRIYRRLQRDVPASFWKSPSRDGLLMA